MNILVSERIKELMQKQGLNQVKLAEKIGVKQNKISAWLLKKKEPCVMHYGCLPIIFVLI